jgi:flavin reductase (DIM6/NTAB) family NADH-FMN oxidoreductase RutF
MPKIQLPPSEALYPVPIALVSCGDSNKANIITIAWCGVVCSKPPMISISVRPSRHSHKIITQNKDFAVNIPREDQLEKVDRCGIVSGSSIDKFKACNFTMAPSSKIRSPIIKECPVNIECKVVKSLPLGAHDMFIGEVVAVHEDEDVLGKNGGIDFKKAGPIVYNRGEYWNLGAKIGYYGFSSKK